ncbi:hypothetical protein MBELCI_1442 [Limimaricola cinnabarinus LL-001]|uniref:Uncharacterized protein n=1 Tax=Limimaricola cinnabarinus LL-001 TaxID=1337093 RepID=U2Z204_9RHOB|nr:hypothetical protein MBELCI_1442 [Limimaricola cinnabarinus LL-001]
MKRCAAKHHRLQLPRYIAGSERSSSNAPTCSQGRHASCAWLFFRQPA